MSHLPDDGPSRIGPHEHDFILDGTDVPKCVHCLLPMPQEAVNHPGHYGGDVTYEVIKVIHAWGLGFDLGNAVKYIARAGKKNPEKTVEDLEKAIWYIQSEIDLIKNGAPS